MPRFFHARPWWRLTFLLSLACALTASSVSSAAAQARPQQQQQGAVREQDPDERAAGGEKPETGDEVSIAGRATLLLTPSRLEVAVGARVRLTLSVLGANDLRRLPATIRFDAAVLELRSVTLGSAWTDGTEPILLHDSGRAGELVIGLGLLDKTEPGISGSAELIELEFSAVGAGNAGLIIDSFAVITAGSRTQSAAALSAEIVVR